MTTLSAFIYFTADKFPKADITQGFGAGIYPMILSVVIFICAMIILVQSILDKGSDKDIEDLKFKNLRNPVIFWLLLLIFCALLKTLGLLLDSFLYLFIASTCLFGVKLKKALLISVAVPLMIWLIFVAAMNVPFPAGYIWEWVGLKA